MKTLRLLLAVSGLLVAAGAAQGQVTINLSAGILYDHNGQLLADGRLVQLVASTTDSVFSAPTATAFVSGDDVVLASFALDSGSFQAGGFVTALPVGTFPNLDAGDLLLLRWFDIDHALGQTAPGATFYGEFRTDDIEHGSDTGWFMPDPDAVIALSFLTLEVEPGTGAAESAGLAAYTTAAVPEPSAYAALAGLLALGAAVWRRRRVGPVSDWPGRSQTGPTP